LLPIDDVSHIRILGVDFNFCFSVFFRDLYRVTAHTCTVAERLEKFFNLLPVIAVFEKFFEIFIRHALPHHRWATSP